MEIKFSSSIWRLGSFLTPDEIYINDDFVRWSKSTGLKDLFTSEQQITIPRKNISSIELTEDIDTGTTIIINSIGGQNIYAQNFMESEAHEIQNILLNKNNSDSDLDLTYLKDCIEKINNK